MKKGVTARAKRETINFEAALQQLNTLVEQMEQGHLSLEESLSHFESGIQLVRQCQQSLQEAEQRIQILAEQAGQATLQPYENRDEDPS